jgi:hypothetical protein
MKKLAAMLGSLFTTIVLSSTPSLEIKDFNFNYNDPSGKGTASQFVYQLKDQFGASTVEVNKTGRDFHVKVAGTIEGAYIFRNAPELLTEAQAINVRELNFNFTDKLSASVGSAVFNSPDQKLKLQKFTLSCLRDLSLVNFYNQAINGCIKQLNLKSSLVSSQSLYEDNLLSLMTKAISNVLGVEVEIADLDLRINSGKYDLSAQIKAQISGKAKSNGEVSYDVKKRILSIKINEVKFTMFDVTSQVFDELKKQESSKMKVKKPYVYLWIDG